MSNIRINIKYSEKPKRWFDSSRRKEHILDRMRNRGIGVEQIKEAVIKGAKRLNPDKTILTEYKWFKVVYREFRVQETRKIYPITVMEV